MKENICGIIFGIIILFISIILMIPTYEYIDKNGNKGTSIYCKKIKEKLFCNKNWEYIEVEQYRR